MVTRAFSRLPGETRWSLYIDESGDFADASSSVVVGGLLVRAEAECGGPGPLRRRLLNAIPIPHWPLHASRINLPVWFALVQVALATDKSAVDPVAAATVSGLGSRCGAELTTALQALANGREPPYEDLRRMNHLLRKHLPREYAALEGWGRRLWAAVAELVSVLAVPDVRPGFPNVAVFAAGETDIPAIDAGSTAAGEDARYRELLACTLERVAAVLGRAGGRHRVGVHVLGRRVFNQVLGQPAPLLPSDVAPIAHAVSTRHAPDVRLVIEEVSRFDPDVNPTLILADFTANHAHRALRSHCTALSVAEAQVRERIPADVRSGKPPLSHLAAGGLAASWVAWAVGQRQSPPSESIALSGQRRRWACEQAYEWISALGCTWS